MEDSPWHLTNAGLILRLARKQQTQLLQMLLLGLASKPTELTIGEQGMLFGEAGFFSITVVRLLVGALFGAIQVQKDLHTSDV